MNKRSRQILNIIFIIFLIGLIVIFTSYAISNINAPKLKMSQDEYIIEYGKDIHRDMDYYISNVNELKKVKFYFNVDNEKGKNYPSVGNYTALVKYNNKITSFTVSVKDTVAPKFIDFQSHITIKKGTSQDELNKQFAAYDLSGANVAVSSENLNLNAEGTYNVVVVASDPYNNTTSSDCVVTVEETDKEEKSGLANAGSYYDNDGNLVYFEEYYSYNDAVSAQQYKNSDGSLTVSSVFESSYGGEVVYRYEWYATKEEKVNIPTSGLADSGTTEITDSSTGEKVVANYQSFFSQSEAQALFNKYSSDTTLITLPITEKVIDYQGESVTIYEVVWYTKPDGDDNHNGGETEETQ